MHVLVPIDGSDPGVRALSFGIDLADRFEGELGARPRRSSTPSNVTVVP
ncbi:universal stress protein [Haloarchaeobius salinus]|nr:universal stress protein [Haloarchaeobius salinus]